MDFADACIMPAIFSIFIVCAVILAIADLRADRRQQRDDPRGQGRGGDGQRPQR